ncbi:hypothetical protein D3C87_431330 [compost metagenome]
MKRLLLVGFAVCFSFLSMAEPPLEVTRGRRGLFGYKQVSEVVGEGRHTLSCFDPGWTACRAMGISVLDETTTLSSDELGAIDSTVDGLIKERDTSGKFVFSNKAVVIYSYNLNTDTVHYKVYSVAQATSLHLI